MTARKLTIIALTLSFLGFALLFGRLSSTAQAGSPAQGTPAGASLWRDADEGDLKGQEERLIILDKYRPVAADIALLDPIIVNSETDAVDANPGDGVCETALGNGECTLRAAIEEANILPDPNIISLPVGTYTLTIAGIGSEDNDTNAIGDLDILGDLTITGNISSTTIISRTAFSGRIFDIIPTVIVNIDNVTIMGGFSFTMNGCGIKNAGNLTITNSTITNNTSVKGGGIFNSGNITVTNSIIKNNGVSQGGGGVFNNGNGKITNSTISNNGGHGNGGGIANHGTLTLIKSTVSDNEGLDHGGGISNEDTMTITESTVSGNHVSGNGGGIKNAGDLSITNSTISDNGKPSVSIGATKIGGGIINTSTLILTNGTVSSNAASQNGGGIVNNNGTVNLVNTILAGNTNTTAPNCSGSLTSQGHNLIGNNTGCTFTPSTADQVGTNTSPINPKLGPLQNNGGPTKTHLPQSSSPAIDAGDNSFCPAADQRGETRPFGSVCDIGAVEAIQLGKIIVNHDEWTLSEQGFPPAQATDAGRFALNVGDWFTGSTPGNFLVYSTPFGDGTTTGLVGDKLASTMTITGGHTWTIISTTTTFSLTDLLEYDGIFLAGVEGNVDNPPPVAPPATQVLIDYVKAGGNVYLAGGTNGANPSGEADQWNPFLKACGLEFESTNNGIEGVLTFTSNHPIFTGVDQLYHNNGNSVNKVPPSEPDAEAAILVKSQGEGLYAVCSFGPLPTAITLASFTAEAGADKVTLAWETASELDNEGFNLWRSTTADGEYTKLNASLIPAQGNTDTGASYTYTDPNIVRDMTYYYKLEDVDTNGVSTFHGPVSATPGIQRAYLPFIIK